VPHLPRDVRAQRGADLLGLAEGGLSDEGEFVSKVLAYVFLGALAVANWVCVFTFGFGLEVHSWWWLIGCGIVGAVVLKTIADVLDKETRGERKKE